ncbi:MAG: hypothetical protein GXP13_09185 [Gammaproteobacteria bacterium]|nr:hypothetical protein [Gammaproteobacteria bacterium]
MSITQTTSLEHWLLLGVFFLLFAIYGFTKNNRQVAGCRPCYYIAFGVLAIVANSLIMFIANRTGVDNFNLVQMLTLKQTTIESSFIVFGYCLIIHGFAMFIRSLFLSPAIKASRSFL